MTTLNEIVSKLRPLPEAQQRRVLRFIEALPGSSWIMVPKVKDDDPIFENYRSTPEEDAWAADNAHRATKIWPGEAHG